MIVIAARAAVERKVHLSARQLVAKTVRRVMESNEFPLLIAAKYCAAGWSWRMFVEKDVNANKWKFKY